MTTAQKKQFSTHITHMLVKRKKSISTEQFLQKYIFSQPQKTKKKENISENIDSHLLKIKTS